MGIQECLGEIVPHLVSWVEERVVLILVKIDHKLTQVGAVMDLLVRFLEKKHL